MDRLLASVLGERRGGIEVGVGPGLVTQVQHFISCRCMHELIEGLMQELARFRKLPGTIELHGATLGA